MKKLILVLSILFSTTAFAGTTDFIGRADYSRPLVKSLAIAYLSGLLGVPSDDLKKKVDEIIVNDQAGIAKYDVEVLFTDNTAHVISFSELDPTGLVVAETP